MISTPLAEVRSSTTNDPSVRAVLSAAHAQLVDLLEEKERVMAKIQAVKKTIAGLALLFGKEILDPNLATLVGERVQGRKRGLTQLCRNILLQSEKPLTTREVHDLINQADPELLKSHKSGMASVTTILRRLVESGKARGYIKEHHRIWESNG